MQRQSHRRMLIAVPIVMGIALAVGVCASSAVQWPVSRYHLTKLADLSVPLVNTPYWEVKLSSEWADETWVGNDAPYQAIERETDKALASSWSIGDLLAKASAAALQNPTDPKAQFRWSYMARQVIKAQPPTYDWDPAIQSIAVVLARANSPKTYSYARLRFLVSDQNPDLTELGERLLRHDPNDAAVKYYLSDDYSALFSKRSQLDRDHSVDPQLKERALTLIEEVIAAHPTDPDYRAGLAAVYVSAWDDKRNPEDASNAIAAYQQYLRLAPPDDNFRPSCLAIISDLQAYLTAHPLP